VIATLAEAASKPGSVDAPVWAIAVGAVVVTAGALLLASGLKPGERREEGGGGMGGGGWCSGRERERGERGKVASTRSPQEVK